MYLVAIDTTANAEAHLVDSCVASNKNDVWFVVLRLAPKQVEPELGAEKTTERRFDFWLFLFVGWQESSTMQVKVAKEALQLHIVCSE